MAVILVTGAEGQLGNELRVVSRNYFGYDFVFTDLNDLDISDAGKVTETINKISPKWILNCAAYNLVEKAESEPGRAMLVNSTAVKYLTDAIRGTDCRLIHFSSDYVLDGSSNVPYNEEAEPSPLSSYGRSKLEGEKNALVHPETMVIRTSWLYSVYGNNFVKSIIRKGQENDTLKVVFDQTGTPTYAADLAEAVMHIVSGVIRNHFAFTAGIYNYSGEGVCTWFDFATEIVKEAGLKCRVLPVLTSEFPSVVTRPAYSVLDKRKIRETYNLGIPHWRSGLVRCIGML